MKLTPKQKAFADEYIICGNATKAAKKAGYSEKTAHVIGGENLKKPAISAYIAERLKPIEEKRIATADDVMMFFTRVINGEEKDAFGLDASLQDKISAGKEILKRHVDDRKIEIELMKLESQLKDNIPEEEANDNFMEALNATATDVWNESDD